MKRDIFSKREFTCFSCLFETTHDWYSLAAIKLANLPLAIEKEEDVTFYTALEPSFFKEKELEKLLEKKVSFEDEREVSCNKIPNLNLCCCTKCDHKTLWFGKTNLVF